MIATTAEDAAVVEYPAFGAQALVVARVVDEEGEVDGVLSACRWNEAEQLLACDEHPLVGLQFRSLAVGVDDVV